jgi:hypothetical protein
MNLKSREVLYVLLLVASGLIIVYYAIHWLIPATK